MGLANRLVEPGTAIDEAIALAARIAEFPQTCLRTDRRSSHEQWSLDLLDALRRETQLGLEALASDELRGGLDRFTSGAGRHGAFDD